MRALTLALLLIAPFASVASASEPLVIAHRGASGERPEHTLAAYALAIDRGADFVEPDLVLTKDGALICRHENEISGTTNVAAVFPDRKRTKTIDGKRISGWFSEDFTLAEIRRLRARERLPFRNHAYDDLYPVPTFAELLDLVQRRARELGRPIGVYPETKHPTYFASIDLPFEAPLLAALREAGLDRADAPVFVQSFEGTILKALRKQTKVRLIQLIGWAPQTVPADVAAAGGASTYGEMLTPAGLKAIAAYADGIGPHKSAVQPVGEDGRLLPATAVVRDAHAAGLLVHVYTLRAEPRYLASGYGGDPRAELRQLTRLGVDGFFTDHPGLAIRWRRAQRGD